MMMILYSSWLPQYPAGMYTISGRRCVKNLNVFIVFLKLILQNSCLGTQTDTVYEKYNIRTGRIYRHDNIILCSIQVHLMWLCRKKNIIFINTSGRKGRRGGVTT